MKNASCELTELLGDMCCYSPLILAVSLHLVSSGQTLTSGIRTWQIAKLKGKTGINPSAGFHDDKTGKLPTAKLDHVILLIDLRKKIIVRLFPVNSVQ